MKISQLKYFLKAAQLQNITRAAAELYISPQALSKQLQLLEEELDFELFERSHGKISLSPVGREIYIEAQKAVNSFDNSVEKMKSIINRDRGNLTLVCPEYALVPFKKDPIAEFKNKYNANVEILEIREVLAADYILKNNLGFGLSCIPFDADEYDSTLIFHSTLCAIVREGHPLRNRKSVSISDIKDYNILARNKLYVVHQNLMNYCENKGIKLKVYSENSHYFNFRTEIQTTDTVGIGISFLNITTGNMVKIPLEEELSWNLYLITKKYTNMPFLERQFVDTILSCAKE